MSVLAPLPTRTLRNSDLPTLVQVLKDQHAAKVDLVVPTSSIRLEMGRLIIDGQEVILGESGVTDPNGAYNTTHVVDQNLADLFGIPVRYIRRMRAEKVSLLDTNVNEWAADAEGRSLLRIIQGSDVNDPNSMGIVRAILSDRYGFRDHLDTVMSVLQGLREVEVDGKRLDASNITGIDLSDERIYLAVDVPEIKVHGKELVKNYHFYDQDSKDNPFISAGLVFTNSEVGRGAFQILPRAVVQVCKNGLRKDVDGFRKVHLGGRLETGSINWSAETQDAANEFVRAQVKDAVKSFLSEGYLENLRDGLLADAGVEIPGSKVDETIKLVGKKLQYSETEQDMILDDFLRGGQITSGGVLNAVTSMVQRVSDPDRAFELEGTSVAAMQLAAQFNS
ncbi:hypothetical protein SEA_SCOOBYDOOBYDOO_59 [Mycobacterium phage ScoobyDoobyDoo]|nr:hypothetical protein SEA_SCOOBYDOOBYDOO_59 [Mycobacterium phage ScoobyDoobyDoo]